jgi:hypothetical protein
MADRVIATAPRPGPGPHALRELGEVVLDPWIDQRPLRLYSAEQFAARAADVGATVLVCEAHRWAGPILDLPLEAIGATRSDPTNGNVDVDVAAASAAGSPCCGRQGETPMLLAPHIGGATYDTEADHTALMAEGLAAPLRGDVPANLANPEVRARG